MSFPTSIEFEKNSDNLREIKQSLLQLERIHKEQIRSNGDWKNPSRASAAVATLRQVHLLTIGILAESFLRKVISDPTGFNQNEKSIIWARKSQHERWITAIELAYRRHKSIPVHQTLDENSIGTLMASQFREVQELVLNSLKPVIEDRNKIAHGQWKWQLKSGKENLFVASNRDFSSFDYCQIKSMKDMVIEISRLIHLLVVSEPAFQREYDAAILSLTRHKSILLNSHYSAFCSTLRPFKAQTS